MKISRRSLLGKLYFVCFNRAWSDSWPREGDADLCHVMRVVFLLLPLKVLSLAAFAAGIAFALAWPGLMLHSWVLGVLVWLVILGVGALTGIAVKLINRGLPEGGTLSVAREYIRARKKRYCPSVEWTDTDAWVRR